MGLFQTVLERAARWGGTPGDAAPTLLPGERLLGNEIPPVALPTPHRELESAVEELWTELTVGGREHAHRSGEVLFLCHWSDPAGATTIALLLAAKASAMDPDLSFCVVDFDLKKRGLTRLLRLEHCTGVWEVLNRETSLESAVVATSQTNVVIVPAGGPDPSGYTVRREHAQGLLRLLIEQYDFVFVDMPALKYNPASIAWMIRRGRSVLVVPSGRIKCESVERALSALHRAELQVAGIVLNRQTFPVPRWLYRWA